MLKVLKYFVVGSACFMFSGDSSCFVEAYAANTSDAPTGDAGIDD